MKKLLLMAVFALPLLFTACVKEEDFTTRLVGTYQGTLQRNIIIEANGQTTTAPVNLSGTAIISRISNSKIVLDFMGTDYWGTVSGDNISFENLTQTYTDADVSQTLNIVASGMISGRTINIRESYSGTMRMQGYTFSLRGYGALVLRKQ